MRRSLLLVEDSDDDFEAFERAYAVLDEPPILRRACTAEECLAQLEAAAESDPASLPNVILLDLNLPGMDGRELLRILKTHAVLRSIPVVILTTSSNLDDVALCYQAHANAYHEKASGAAAARDQVRGFYDYWFADAILPSLRDIV